jgi:hypothetical protein
MSFVKTNGRSAVANGNVVRGFLIHNGVLIQGGAWGRVIHTPA